MGIWADRERRAAEWYGWNPSSARPCPRVLAGKRCQWFTHPTKRCICERYSYSLLDHAVRWKSGDEPILTGEPYHVDPDTFSAFQAELMDLGLEVSYDPDPADSPWNPGATYLITVRRSGWAQRRLERGR